MVIFDRSLYDLQVQKSAEAAAAEIEWEEGDDDRLADDADGEII